MDADQLISPPIADNAILLTGATGFVGQYLLVDLLKSGRQVVVLARSRKMQPAESRIEAILRFWEKELGRLLIRPKVIDIDLRNDHNQLPTAQRDWIHRNVGIVLHSAASVQFDYDPRTNEPIASNFDGTKKLLQFAIEHSIPHFHHISTAYVAGNRSGRVLEDELDVGQKLNNTYEQSKFDAELLVESNRHKFQSLTIHRPSIVVGDSKTGFAPNFHTVYGLIPFARALNLEFKQEDGFFQSMKLTGLERKNIVFVDWLAEQISHTVQNPIYWGRRYHWTTPTPVTAATLFHSIIEAISSSRQEWEAMGRWMPRLDIETAVNTHLDIYLEYLRDDPLFDRSNAQSIEKNPPPSMQQPDLVRLFAYAIRRQVQSYVYRLDGSHDLPALSFPLQSRNESFSTRSPRECFMLEVSGPNGGQWVIDIDGVIQDSNQQPIARAHVSGWAWRELVKDPSTAETWIRQSKILIAGPDFMRNSIIEVLKRLASASLFSTSTKMNSNVDRSNSIVGGRPHE